MLVAIGLVCVCWWLYSGLGCFLVAALCCGRFCVESVGLMLRLPYLCLVVGNLLWIEYLCWV